MFNPNGSGTNNGILDAKCGTGVGVGDSHPLNSAWPLLAQDKRVLLAPSCAITYSIHIVFIPSRTCGDLWRLFCISINWVNKPTSTTRRMSEQDVFYVPAPTLPAVVPPDSYDAYRGHGTLLIIDNGASDLRIGFSLDSNPHVAANIVARYKERKSNQFLLLFGNEVEADSSAKGQVRTPWEGDVLLNSDALVRRRIFLHPDSLLSLC